MDRAGWDARYHTTDLVWRANPNQFLVAEVAELAPGTALDLGAGEGRNAVSLAQRGWQVTWVDFSAVGLAKAAQLADAAAVTLPTVCADVARSGLVIDRADRVHRSVEAADGERMAIDALVRARRPRQP